MLSQTEILAQLKSIASRFNLTGESVELQEAWLAYLFSTLSTEVATAVSESNIETASLMNSKIEQSMKDMYSVYRGRCPRLVLRDYQCNSQQISNLYDLVYSSNHFYIYALGLESNTYDYAGINIDILAHDTYEYIISDKPKYEITKVVTADNTQYVDVELDNQILEGLSEDLMVKINGVQQKVTRLFFTHINSSTMPSQLAYTSQYENNTLSETSGALFALTIPDFGIRIYKLGGFNVTDSVQVTAFHYITKKQLVESYESEVLRIKFQGFTMTTDIDSDPEGTNNYIKDSTDRDDLNSIHYHASAFSHVQSQIMTNSDVDILFEEYFKDYILSSAHAISSDLKPKCYIYYVPRGTQEITTAMADDFKKTFTGRYVSQDNVAFKPAKNRIVEVDLNLVMSKSTDLSAQLQTVFDNYSNKMAQIISIDDSGNVTSLSGALSYKKLFGQVSKLTNVSYIDSMRLQSENIIVEDASGDLNKFYVKNGLPCYLQFVLNVTYTLE